MCVCVSVCVQTSLEVAKAKQAAIQRDLERAQAERRATDELDVHTVYFLFFIVSVGAVSFLLYYFLMCRYSRLSAYLCVWLGK